MSLVGFKTECYPTEEQKRYIDELIDIQRWYWNKLHETIRETEPSIKGRRFTVYPIAKSLLPDWDCSKFGERLVAQVAKAYTDAWQACFKRIRRAPNFHSRRNSKKSVVFCSLSSRVSGTVINIPGAPRTLKELRLAEPIRYCGVLNTLTLSKRDGRYFVSMNVSTEIQAKDSGTGEIGMDYGVKDFFTDNSGNRYSLPDKINRLSAQIANLNRILAEKVRSSANWEKVRAKLSRAYAKQVAIKKDFIEKLTYKLLSENHLIALEDLDIQGLLRKAHSNRRAKMSINAFGLFRTRITQKNERFPNATVIFADKYFPSSQICCLCGSRKRMPLNIRLYTCECGNEMDRDQNAAQNLLTESRRVLGSAQ